MHTIGTPVSASGATKYFNEDFADESPASAKQDALTESSKPDHRIVLETRPTAFLSEIEEQNELTALGQTLQTKTIWFGKLADEFDLSGAVRKKDFSRLADGRNPQTGAQLIRHVKPRTFTKKSGKVDVTKSHRAGLDQTINAPKSVSLVALEDPRVILVHWNAAVKTIGEIEKFTRAKMGNANPSELTSKALYAAFLHYRARPDAETKYAAPDLHAHFFQFNIVKTKDEKYRALETREVFGCQKLATAIYRSELVKEMRKIGYDMTVNENTGAPEVAGISREYIKASSPRQQEIHKKAQSLGVKSTRLVAANYRQSKNFDQADMRRRDFETEEKFGFEARQAAEIARLRTQATENKKQYFSRDENDSIIQEKSQKGKSQKTSEAAAAAIVRAKELKKSEKAYQRRVSWQSLMADALNFSRLEATIEEVNAEFVQRAKRGELDEFNLDRQRTVRSSSAGGKIKDPRQRESTICTNADLKIKDHELQETINITAAETAIKNEPTEIAVKQHESEINRLKKQFDTSPPILTENITKSLAQPTPSRSTDIQPTEAQIIEENNENIYAGHRRNTEETQRTTSPKNINPANSPAGLGGAAEYLGGAEHQTGVFKSNAEEIGEVAVPPAELLSSGAEQTTTAAFSRTGRFDENRKRDDVAADKIRRDIAAFGIVNAAPAIDNSVIDRSEHRDNRASGNAFNFASQFTETGGQSASGKSVRGTKTDGDRELRSYAGNC